MEARLQSFLIYSSIFFILPPIGEPPLSAEPKSPASEHSASVANASQEPPPVAGLRLSMVDSQDPIPLPSPVDIGIEYTATNTGPDRAINVVIKSTLPARFYRKMSLVTDLEQVSWLDSPSQPSFSHECLPLDPFSGSSCKEDLEGFLVCELGTVLEYSCIKFTIMFSVSITSKAPLFTSAVISSPTDDPNLLDNEACELTAIKGDSPLSCVPIIFANGFESGTLSAWSSTAP